MRRFGISSLLLLLTGAATLAGAWGLALGWPSRPPRGDSSSPLPRLPSAPSSLEASLAPGEVHAYAVELAAGDFLHAVVEQRGVDLVVSLVDPRGRPLLEVDSPNGVTGPEELFALAARPGCYRLEVRPWDGAGPGSYRLRVLTRRAAAAGERARAEAAQALADGERLRREGGTEAFDKARGRLLDALSRWQALAEPAQQAITLRRLGQLWFQHGDLRQAVACFEQARILLATLERPDLEAGLLNVTGAAYRLLGETEAASTAYQQARAAARALGDRREEVVAVNNLALLHRSTGRLWQALLFYDRALAGWRELGDTAGEAVTLHNLGVAYTLLGKLPEALDALSRALELRRDAGDQSGEAATLTAIGWVHLWSQEPAAALEDFGSALLLRRQAGDRRGEGVTLDRLATTQIELGRLEEAADLYAQALRLLRSTGDRVSEAHTLNNLGELRQRRGELAAALDCHRRALRLFRRMEEPIGEAHALYRIAHAERRRGRLAAARSAIGESLTVVESLRDASQSRALRASYFASVHDYYTFAVGLLMESHAADPDSGYAERALEVAERGRARVLLETLAQPWGEGEPAAGGPLRRREEELERAIADLDRERLRRQAAGAEPEQLDGLQSELRHLLMEVEKLRTRIRTAAGPGLATAQPLSVAEIQGLLDPETLLLSYSLGEERSYLALVSPHQLSTYPLPGREVIEELAQRLHRLLARSHQRGVEQQARLTARALGEMLLAPVADRLGTKRLVVVADGALQLVSFAALLPAAPPDREAPLVADHEIVTLPSASVLAALRRRRAHSRPAPGTLAMIADPVFQRDDPRLARRPGPSPPAGEALRLAAAASPGLERSVAELGLDRYPRLPSSRREAESILALVPAAQTLRAVGFAANRELVTGGELERYRILHFATHGLLHGDFPELSGVVLSRYDPQGRPQEGFLRAHEISRLRLNADLVVLSACRSALGKPLKGEGLVGLTQAFLDAGAERVVVSLWNVNDEGAAELMERFYRGVLDGGLSPAAALRAAQLEMWALPRWRAPYYWAGFTLRGEWKGLREGAP